jgi:hypothetical protein
MTRHRTTARGILFLILCGAAVAAACATAGAAKPPIVFPVLGPVSYSDDFGDARATNRHEGNDILAPRKAIAVAAEGGTVKFWTTSAQAGCMLYLYGDSGTTYLYIHLNNDLGKGNDNKGTCVAGTAYAPGMKNGDRVEAGQPVGFVGDSGDANGIHPHLHFEVHPKDGAAVDPYPYLRKARPLLFTEPDGKTFSLVLDGVVKAVGPGTLTITVDTLKEWPSHHKLTKLGRTLTVTLPGEALVSGGGTGAAARQASPAPRPADTAPPPGDPVPRPGDPAPRPGDKVRIWTGPQTTTPEARLGAAGAIGVLRLAPR